VKQLQSSGVVFASAVVAILVSQPAWAVVTQVIGVQLNPTSGGLNLVMQTSTGARPQIFTGTRGKVLVADIINTQLRLPQGNSFRQQNPAPGIDSVAITQLDPNTIRIFVIGTLSAPRGEIAQRTAQGITLSFSPGLRTAALSPTTPSTPTAPQNSPAQPQLAQTPRAQTPSVLVPNPQITIDGKPATAAQTAQPGSSAPPFLPRAVAPPVGDIAVSNSDASPEAIKLDTNERVPRLVLRDAPAREVLALLARAAGLNLVFTQTPAAGDQGQPPQPAATGAGANNPEGPTISLDIQNESVQDVFNYVLRVAGLQANRNGNTVLVGTNLSNQARNVIIRSFRLNQVTVGVALNFLVGLGAESAVSRERVVTSVTAVPLATGGTGGGGAAQPQTQQTQTTETRVETNRVNFQDAVPILRGVQAIGDERTNSVTLVGSPKQVDVATTQLTQLDSRRRQVAVNVKIVDVNLSAINSANASFSFGIGNNFFQNSQGTATFNFGKTNQPDFGGFTGLQTHSNRFIAVLQSTIQNGNSKILTDPTLIIQEGQTANVNLTSEVVGNVTNQTNFASGTAIQTVTATKENVGLALTVRIDRIDDNGFIALSVAPIVRALAGSANLGAQQITLVSERSLNSGVLRIRDNQTLILAGIIQDSDRASVQKVPLLGDIPILGALFRSTTKTHGRQEVIVLLTPEIIDDSTHSSFGYNYMPSPEVRQMLERRGLNVPKK
jgi:type IV pilus assembly protein PilQ